MDDAPHARPVLRADRGGLAGAAHRGGGGDLEPVFLPAAPALTSRPGGSAGNSGSSPSRSRAPTIRRCAAWPWPPRNSASMCSSGPDHYLKMGDVSGLPGPDRRVGDLAAWPSRPAASGSGRLRRAAMFRLPGPLAITVAQIDQMSGGGRVRPSCRWFAAEHAAQRYPVPPLGRAVRRAGGAARHHHRAMGHARGGMFSFDGAHYQVSDSPALPKPAQRPRPPVLLAVGTRRTPRLAARFADEFGRCSSRRCGIQRPGSHASARPARTSAATPIPSPIPWLARWCAGRHGAEFRRRAAAIGRDPAEAREHGVGGTPGEVVAKIAEYAEIGAERVYLQVLDLADLDHLALIASDVVPQL